MEASRMQIIIRPIRLPTQTNKPKRFRSAFTTEQIKYLELQFKKFPYISSEHRNEIATTLNMQERAVKIWFQNRRMKEKKESTNKEYDNATTTKAEESGKDRLNNVSTLPSTNGQPSYSIPVIMKPVDNMGMQFSAPNTIHRGIRQKVDIQQVPQNLSTSYIKSPMNLIKALNVEHQAPNLNELTSTHRSEPSRKQFKNRNQQFHRKPVDLSKRLKKPKRDINQDHKTKLHKKSEVHPSIAVKSKTFNQDSSSKKKTTAPSSRLSKQAKANGPKYFPVMPTVYAHSYISHGGVIWKPINIMPAVTPGTAIPVTSHSQQSFGHDQKMNCNCNCHGNAQPMIVPPNLTSPYPQYVFTASAPYRNSSSKF